MTPVQLLIALAILSSGWLLVRRRRRLANLPPALPGLPLLGNIHQLPLTAIKLDQWKDQCGPIYSLNLAGQVVVVLASAKVASDVLDKMSAVTSGRPRWIMGAEYMVRHGMLNTMQYGEGWRRHRRAAHEALNIRAAEAFYDVQADEAMLLAQGLLMQGASASLQAHTARAAASTVWRALYGGPPLALIGDKTLDDIHYITETVIKSLGPGGALVDVFPFLRFLPKQIAPFKRFADNFYEYANGFFSRVSKEACLRKSSAADPTILNICASLDAKKARLGMNDWDVAWLGGMLFIAGEETTATAIQYFVLAMTLYPEVARKAQQEIDEVVGMERAPTFGDRDRLPYVHAIVKETLRWRPVVAIGVTHAATEDFVYEGYTIPKGALLADNLWSVCRDPEIFPDFDTFRPERFLEPEEGDSTATSDRALRFEDGAFGHGRRICVGRDVAINSLYIDLAILLWAFEFQKVKDAHGVEITPSSMDFHDTGATVRPNPFPYKLVARSDAVESILSEYGKGAD